VHANCVTERTFIGDGERADQLWAQVLEAGRQPGARERDEPLAGYLLAVRRARYSLSSVSVGPV
jgi:hypothetical protein